MEQAVIDVLLAIAHYVVAIALAGVLALQIAAIGRELAAEQVLRLARLNVWYGVLLFATFLIGFALAENGAHPSNDFFRAKIAVCVAVALLSGVPGVLIYRWKCDAIKFPAATPCSDEVAAVRRSLWAQAAGFAAVIVLSILAARG